VAVQPGKWTVGLLVSNLFSVAGPSNRANVNAFTSSTSSTTTSRKAITSHSRRSSPPTGTLPVATFGWFQSEAVSEESCAWVFSQ
jgi:hypothetical protein